MVDISEELLVALLLGCCKIVRIIARLETFLVFHFRILFMLCFPISSHLFLEKLETHIFNISKINYLVTYLPYFIVPYKICLLHRTAQSQSRQFNVD